MPWWCVEKRVKRGNYLPRSLEKREIDLMPDGMGEAGGGRWMVVRDCVEKAGGVWIRPVSTEQPRRCPGDGRRNEELMRRVGDERL